MEIAELIRNQWLSISAATSRPEVNIDENDLRCLWNTQNGLCLVSGRCLLSHGNIKLFKPTIELIDSDGAYTVGNIAFVCYAFSCKTRRSWVDVYYGNRYIFDIVKSRGVNMCVDHRYSIKEMCSTFRTVKDRERLKFGREGNISKNDVQKLLYTQNGRCCFTGVAFRYDRCSPFLPSQIALDTSRPRDKDNTGLIITIMNPHATQWTLDDLISVFGCVKNPLRDIRHLEGDENEIHERLDSVGDRCEVTGCLFIYDTASLFCPVWSCNKIVIRMIVH